MWRDQAISGRMRTQGTETSPVNGGSIARVVLACAPGDHSIVSDSDKKRRTEPADPRPLTDLQNHKHIQWWLFGGSLLYDSRCDILCFPKFQVETWTSWNYPLLRIYPCQFFVLIPANSVYTTLLCNSLSLWSLIQDTSAWKFPPKWIFLPEEAH